MEKNKPLLKEILRLLNYLQENDSNREKLNPLFIFGKEKIDSRITGLCNEGGYTVGNHNVGWEITIKGIQFLEENKKIKTQQDQTVSQNFLTLGILSFAIFSGILTMIYYYQDLLMRGNKFGGSAIFLSGVILLIVISIGILKLMPKRKNE